MKELNTMEIESVAGGWKFLVEAIIGNAVYDVVKSGFSYAMENSHMGQGRFPSVPRAGHE